MLLWRLQRIQYWLLPNDLNINCSVHVLHLLFEFVALDIFRRLLSFGKSRLKEYLTLLFQLLFEELGDHFFANLRIDLLCRFLLVGVGLSRLRLDDNTWCYWLREGVFVIKSVDH